MRQPPARRAGICSLWRARTSGVELRRTLQQAGQSSTRVIRDRVAVSIGDVRKHIRLTIEPFGHSVDEPLFRLFAEAATKCLKQNPAGSGEPSPAGAAQESQEESADKDEIIGQIERELADTHERWLATITEYEGAIEELKSERRAELDERGAPVHQ